MNWAVGMISRGTYFESIGGWYGDTPHPDDCATAAPRRVGFGDFETKYEHEIPQSDLRLAVTHVQRNVLQPPFCGASQTYAELLWLKYGADMVACWLCMSCVRRSADGLFALGHGTWYGLAP